MGLRLWTVRWESSPVGLINHEPMTEAFPAEVTKKERNTKSSKLTAGSAGGARGRQPLEARTAPATARWERGTSVLQMQDTKLCQQPDVPGNSSSPKTSVRKAATWLPPSFSPMRPTPNSVRQYFGVLVSC